MNEKGNIWRTFGVLLAITSLVPLFMGFNKMFSYNSGELFSTPVNAYVGGDAYNFIINANYATGYFVLSGALFLSALGCGALWYLAMIRNSLINNSLNVINSDTEKTDAAINN